MPAADHEANSGLVWKQPSLVAHAQVLLESYRRLLGSELIERSGDALDEAERLFHTPCVVVSHGTEPDPILNYGNLTALTLWETDFAALTQMPSRLTAEPLEREERARLLARTAEQGFVDDYRGIRISRTGQRFLIERAIIWNLQDTAGIPVGQAATFARWLLL
ncbi:MAG: MEKHLA domain-containing protein [Planctomycetia bacterium]|nr:MEKHLA domain-containing protein [Planctomycetia bacterium]